MLQSAAVVAAVGKEAPGTGGVYRSPDVPSCGISYREGRREACLQPYGLGFLRDLLLEGRQGGHERRGLHGLTRALLANCTCTLATHRGGDSWLANLSYRGWAYRKYRQPFLGFTNVSVPVTSPGWNPPQPIFDQRCL